MAIIKFLLSLLLGSGTKAKVMDLVKEQLLGKGNVNLGPLIEQLKAGGLSDAVASWVGTGKNQPVTGDQVGQALGPAKLSELARQCGLSVDVLKAQLAKLLPQVIDRVTPDGRLPS